MKAIQVQEVGDPDGLQYVDAPTPEPGAGEVAIPQPLTVALPQGGQVISIVAEPEPPLAGKEVDEHQPVEQRLHEGSLALFFALAELGYCHHRAFEYALVLGEEPQVTASTSKASSSAARMRPPSR